MHGLRLGSIFAVTGRSWSPHPRRLGIRSYALSVPSKIAIVAIGWRLIPCFSLTGNSMIDNREIRVSNRHFFLGYQGGGGRRNRRSVRFATRREQQARSRHPHRGLSEPAVGLEKRSRRGHEEYLNASAICSSRPPLLRRRGKVSLTQDPLPNLDVFRHR